MEKERGGLPCLGEGPFPTCARRESRASSNDNQAIISVLDRVGEEIKDDLTRSSMHRYAKVVCTGMKT